MNQVLLFENVIVLFFSQQLVKQLLFYNKISGIVCEYTINTVEAAVLSNKGATYGVNCGKIKHNCTFKNFLDRVCKISKPLTLHSVLMHKNKRKRLKSTKKRDASEWHLPYHSNL